MLLVLQGNEALEHHSFKASPLFKKPGNSKASTRITGFLLSGHGLLFVTF
jgi:hypothetical protein